MHLPLFHRTHMPLRHPSKKIVYVQYMGKPVDKENFRVFVYGREGQLLCKNYDAYQSALESGKWYVTQDEVPKPKPRKVKPDAPDSERVCT